jgi:molybdenum cofactor guanylyltransferase
VEGPLDPSVLAGGASSRMGRDKALLEIGGHPLIARALDKLRALGPKLSPKLVTAPRIAGSRPDLSSFAPVIPDNFPGCGPLAGIEAALSASASDLHLFLPVDLPLLPVEFLAWMAQRAEASGAAATLPMLAGRPQPLCAVYRRSLLPGLRAALAARRYKVMPAIEQAAADSIDAFEIKALAPSLIPSVWPARPPVEDWFRNLNTPEDYELLRDASGANARNPLR